MWSYYRDNEGYVIALEDHYAKLLEENVHLQHAVSQIYASKALIEAIMENLEVEEQNNETVPD
jgi:hypothetical protein